jgi:insertion element IS1 protein InsB
LVLWWAIDHATQRVVGWTLGERDTRAARALAAQIPRGAGLTYYTDHWPCYCAIFPKSQHIRSEAHTHIIESMNNRLRCYLARLRRKTPCYSKSAANLRDSLLFIFARKLRCPLVPSTLPPVENDRLWNDSISIPV